MIAKVFLLAVMANSFSIFETNSGFPQEKYSLTEPDEKEFFGDPMNDKKNRKHVEREGPGAQNCEDHDFCHRQRTRLNDTETEMHYDLDASSISNTTNGTITGTLNLKNGLSSATFAATLQLTLTFYQNGIMRTLIEE